MRNIRFSFLLFLILITLVDCQSGPGEPKDTSQTHFDSISAKVERFFEDYYDWKYDSTQIMAIFD